MSRTPRLFTLVQRAKEGNLDAQEALRNRSDSVAKKVNSRLSQLEKAGLDFYAYDELINFTSVQYDHATRLQASTSKYLKDDWDAMKMQIQWGERFLKRKSSSVAGQREIMDKRTQEFMRRGLFGFDKDGNPLAPKNNLQARNFQKFIGKSGLSELMDYGMSDVILEAFYTAYNRGMSRPMLTRIIDEAMTDINTVTNPDDIMHNIIEPTLHRLVGRKGGTYGDLIVRRARYAQSKLPEPLRRGGGKRAR